MKKTFIFIVLLLNCSLALAYCPDYQRGGISTVTLPSILTIPATAQVGDVIYTETSTKPTNARCNASFSYYPVARSNISYSLSSINGVYKTSIPGVGFRIRQIQYQRENPFKMDTSVQLQYERRVTGGSWLDWIFELVITAPVTNGKMAAFTNPIITSYMSGSSTQITDWEYYE